MDLQISSPQLRMPLSLQATGHAARPLVLKGILAQRLAPGRPERYQIYDKVLFAVQSPRLDERADSVRPEACLFQKLYGSQTDVRHRVILSMFTDLAFAQAIRERSERSGRKASVLLILYADQGHCNC